MWFFNNNSGVPFTEKDIPSQQGRVFLVTGANSGLGKQTVLELACHGAHEIWLTARTAAKAAAAIAAIQARARAAAAATTIRPLVLDLASAASVRAAARAVAATAPRLDILVLNAGCMGAPSGLTADGLELQLGTNHVGHALLVRLLAPVLAADVRVVVLSSAAVAVAPAGGIVFDSLATPQEALGTWARYGQSKLANALYARQLARQHPEWTVAAVHPGVVNTNLSHYAYEKHWYLRPVSGIINRLLTTVEVGARNQLWAATAPKEEIKSGELYYPVGDLTGGRRGPYTKDDALAKRLWDWTEQVLKDRLLLDGEEETGLPE